MSELKSFIKLSGNQFLLTENLSRSYRILEGDAYLYIAEHLEDGSISRRVWLCALSKGKIIPGFYIREKLNNKVDESNYVLVVVAKEHLVLEEKELESDDFEDLKKELNLYGNGDIYSLIFRCYRQQIANDSLTIDSSVASNQSARRTILGRIYHLFSGDSAAFLESSGNPAYSAAARICEYMGIHYISWPLMVKSCGVHFDVNDFARLSGFVCREIALDDNWIEQDIGPFLGYYGKSKQPCAVIPDKHGYSLYVGKNEEGIQVTFSIAEKIYPKGMMFYRPFPYEKLNLSKLIRFAMKQTTPRDYIGIVVLAVFGVIIGLLVPFINEKVYDLFIPLGDEAGLIGICLVIAACQMGNVSFSLVKGFANFRLSNKMKYSVQSAVYDRVFTLPQSVLRQYDSADMAMRAYSIPDAVAMVVSTATSVGLTALLSLLYLWRMFKKSRKLTWVAIVMVAITLIVILIIGYRQVKYEKEKKEIDLKLSSMLYQLFEGISKLRIAGAEERGISQYMNRFMDSVEINYKLIQYDNWTNIIVSVASTVFSIFFYLIMARKSIDFSIGSFMGFIASFGSFSMAMLEVGKSWLTINVIKPTIEKGKPILESLPEINENGLLPTELTGEIDINNVSFSYETDGPKILQNLSLHIKSGEYVGIVGTSGCGKSTLMKLLLRFETPTQGKIYYDGQDLESLDKRELRKQFGVVLQDGGLIPGSIADNISIAHPGVKLKDIKKAVKDAGLEADIAQMPMGLNTVLSEGSGGVSGGQKQRILIARAIAGNPKILFFDEATSALDNITQGIICDSLEALHCTRIVIAHRLSTIMNCDRIVVMHKGEIAEQGSYDELMAQKGRFYELAKRQVL